jgi:DNA-binding transcriptional LysR family regulator
MDRIAEMRTLVAVADAASFSEAAQRLGLSPPTVTRSIAALERRLGARLVARTTRSLRLTEAGLQFVEDARRALGEIEAAEQSAAGRHARARGTLRLTAPVLFGEIHLLPLLRVFLDQYPEVQAEALLLDRVVNLVEEGLDVALRIGGEDDSGLETVPLGSVRRMLLAAPAYLQQHGTPQTPQDLGHHRIAMSVGASASRTWFFGAEANATSVRIDPVLTVSSLRAAIDAARAGWALTRALSYQVQEDLADGRLLPVLEAYEPPPLPVRLVYPASRRPSARLMAFVELASERIAAALRGL